MKAITEKYDFDPTAYVPEMARLVDVTPMTERETFFRVALPRPLRHQPGQFVMVSRLGVGEAPISISCGPRVDNLLEMVIRDQGGVTRVLNALKPGDHIGIRGPYGSGYDLEAFYGKDIVLVAGGLGLVPLRSLIQPVVAQSERFGRITIISGFRTPAEELFREEARSWSEHPKVEMVRLVDDDAHMPWDGRVGLVTAPLAELEMNLPRTLAVLCGPPVMYKFVIMELALRGLPTSQIFVDLERRMKCGIGKCGHCQINNLYCCQAGPVFRFSDIEMLKEALS